MGNEINGGVNNDSLAKLKAIINDGIVSSAELNGLSKSELEALRTYLQGEGADLPKDGEIRWINDKELDKIIRDGRIQSKEKNSLDGNQLEKLEVALHKWLDNEPELKELVNSKKITYDDVKNLPTEKQAKLEEYLKLFQYPMPTKEAPVVDLSTSEEIAFENMVKPASVIGGAMLFGGVLDFVKNVVTGVAKPITEAAGTAIKQLKPVTGAAGTGAAMAACANGKQDLDEAEQDYQNYQDKKEQETEPGTIVPGNSTTINNTLTITVTSSDSALADQLKNQNDNNTELIKNHIETEMENGRKLDAIIAALDSLSISLDNLVNAMIACGKTTTEILATLLAVGKTTTEILDALKANGNKLSDIAIQLRDNKDILNEISGKNTKIYDALNNLLTQNTTFNDEQKNTLNIFLKKIDELVAKGVDLSNIEDLLASTLEKIGKLDENSAAGFGKVLSAINENTDVSKKILDMANKIYNAMANTSSPDYTNMLNKMLDMLGTIAAKKDQPDLTNIENLLNTMLGKIDTAIKNQKDMSKENKDFYNKLLAKLDGMSEDAAKAFNDFLAAIKENTDVAKGTFEVATLILEGMGNLGDKADEAINVFKSLSAGGVCNFNQADMQAFIKAIANSLIDTYTSGNKKLYDKLNEILNKIPNSCTCDGNMIIDRLNTIIDNMKTAPDDKTHEGIIGDLGELFG